MKLKNVSKIIQSTILAFICTASISAQSLWDGTSSDKSWYNDAETEFHITTAAQLKGLADIVNDGNKLTGKEIQIDSDIDLNNYEWTPIGVWGTNYSFSGIFNGNGHTITGIKPTMPDNSTHFNSYGVLGFFGMASGTIKNVYVKGSIEHTTKSSSDQRPNIGGLVGYCSGSIENVKVDFDIHFSYAVLSGGYCGTVCGTGWGHIKEARACGKIDFDNNSTIDNFCIGGIAGGFTTIEQAISYTNISSKICDSNCKVGGIIGQASTNNDITDCAFYGALSLTKGVYAGNTTYASIGGICGYSYQCNFTNVIFSPSSFTSETNGYTENPIIGNKNEGTCTNAYYTMFTTSNNNLGLFVDNSYLYNPINGFSEDIWKFSKDKLPMIKSLMNKYFISFGFTNGSAGYEVEEGGTLHIKIVPDNEYCVAYVYLNNKDITDMLYGNTLILEDVYSDGSLYIVFKRKNATAINKNSADDTNIKIKNGEITFNGIKNNTLVTIYSLDGKVVEKRYVNPNGSIAITHGEYIIKMNNSSFKVIL